MKGLVSTIYVRPQLGDRDNRTPVQWSGYDHKLARYHGVITNKAELQKKFDLRLSACETDPSHIHDYDWTATGSVESRLPVRLDRPK